ncbi:MAG TPA: hypothetical protein VJA28_02055 [Patescibacteria group bacterium]|nr:hypothetical protein [Patescibacteria group bacterium]
MQRIHTFRTKERKTQIVRVKTALSGDFISPLIRAATVSYNDKMHILFHFSSPFGWLLKN